ncbi:hypothetical protein EBT31_20560, partial [bacterium]|nr:hypothetical protein [bacterium]
ESLESAAKDAGYLAICAFLNRGEDDAILELRYRLETHLRIPVTFAAASGGSGTYTYDPPVVTHSVGSGASASGTAPGSVTVSGLANADVLRVTVTVTDTVTGQTATMVAEVSVAASASTAWTSHAEFDFTTGLAVASSSATSGSLAVTTTGGAAYATVLLGGSGTATSRSVSVGSGGLVVSVTDDGDATSSGHQGAVQISTAGLNFGQPILIELLVDSVTLTQDSDAPMAAGFLGPSATAAAGTWFVGPRYGTTSDFLFRLYSGSSTSTQQTPAAAVPAQGRIQWLLTGSAAEVRWKAGANTFLGAIDTSPDLVGSGSLSGSVAASVPTSPYSGGLAVGGYVNAKGPALLSSVRVTKLKVWKPGYTL